MGVLNLEVAPDKLLSNVGIYTHQRMSCIDVNRHQGHADQFLSQRCQRKFCLSLVL